MLPRGDIWGNASTFFTKWFRVSALELRNKISKIYRFLSFQEQVAGEARGGAGGRMIAAVGAGGDGALRWGGMEGG